MLFNEIPTTFPWYEKKEQMDRYRENVEPICDYKLISPRDALLPFQFYKVQQSIAPNLWEIMEVNSDIPVANITTSLSALRIKFLEGKEYYSYDGRALNTASGPLVIPPGWYYSRLAWSNGQERWSEMFHVPDLEGFNVGTDGNIEFMKLEFWNDADLRPIYYNDPQPNGKPYFRNVLYIDSFITASEPEVEEDGERDGEDTLIATFQKVITPFRITVGVPDYLKRALVSIPLHDHFVITTQNGVRTGEVEKSAVNSTLEASGGLSLVDILFQEYQIIKKGCGENMASDCVGVAPVIADVELSGTNYILTGTAPAGTVVTLYRVDSPTSTPIATTPTEYTAANFASGITIDVANFFGSNYIAVKAATFGCDFGYSNVVPKP